MPAETIRIDRLGQPVAGFPKVIRSFDFTVQGYCNSYGELIEIGQFGSAQNEACGSLALRSRNTYIYI
jgi:hypothetical protein